MKINKNNNLTAIIIAKNEAEMLPSCLSCLQFCQQIIVINNNSTDETALIAHRYGVRTLDCDSQNFAEIRNFAAAHVQTEWMVYIDADERVTPLLAREINRFTCQNDFSAAEFSRQNYLYGHHIRNAGYDRDRVIRLFQKKHFIEWTGRVHETPVYSGSYFSLLEPLLHLTHRSTHDNLLKSAEWTLVEAELLAASSVKKITKFTLLRKGGAEFYRRYWRDKGRLDGMPGFIESVVQALNKVMIYIQVWELQQKPSLPIRYQKIAKKLELDWSRVDWQTEN